MTTTKSGAHLVINGWEEGIEGSHKKAQNSQKKF
jgi:hypothetical protein